MGSELLRIAEGFSIVAEGLRGLAKAEGGWHIWREKQLPFPAGCAW